MALVRVCIEHTHGLLATSAPTQLRQCPAAGALDVRRFALAGHSFGGASIGDLCAADPSFVCGIALDPWWCAPQFATSP